mmetsp:Transcript_4621/g.10172  ORF Transcript_4621/g.10172 Transcript_4621/m.10172 type:complete len:206 (+) Transcript_4621:893-1510(+)
MLAAPIAIRIPKLHRPPPAVGLTQSRATKQFQSFRPAGTMDVQQVVRPGNAPRWLTHFFRSLDHLSLQSPPKHHQPAATRVFRNDLPHLPEPLPNRGPRPQAPFQLPGIIGHSRHQRRHALQLRGPDKLVVDPVHQPAPAHHILEARGPLACGGFALQDAEVGGQAGGGIWGRHPGLFCVQVVHEPLCLITRSALQKRLPLNVQL